MNFNYSGMEKTSRRLINKFGAAVDLIQITEGGGDPMSGVTGDTETITTVNAVKLDFNSHDIDETQVKTGDFILLINGQQDLTAIDKVDIEGVRYEIVRLMPLKPGDTRLLTKAHCRK